MTFCFSWCQYSPVALSSSVATDNVIALMSGLSFMYLLTLVPVCCGVLSMMIAILPNRRCSSLRNLIDVLIKPVVRSEQRAPVCGNGPEDSPSVFCHCILQPAAYLPGSSSRNLHCHLVDRHSSCYSMCNPAFSGFRCGVSCQSATFDLVDFVSVYAYRF